MRLNYSRTGASGIVYDGVNLCDIFQIVDITIPLLPTVEAVTHDLAQRPGSYFAARKVGTREIKLKLRLDAETRNPMGIFQAWREYSDVLCKSEPKRLYLDEEKFCNAIFVGESQIEDDAYYGVIELTFMCFDPYFYGEEHSLDIPTGNRKTINPLGNCASFPIVTIKTNGTMFAVKNVTTGESVELGPLSSNVGTITVDMERQISMLGDAYQPVKLESDYFSVSPGDVVFFSNCSGTIAWRDRWL